MYYTILYYTILYYDIALYYTILYYTILYYTILYHFLIEDMVNIAGGVLNDTNEVVIGQVSPAQKGDAKRGVFKSINTNKFSERV